MPLVQEAVEDGGLEVLEGGGGGGVGGTGIGEVRGVQVVVVGGRGMPRMDAGFFSRGSCDPYLKIACGDTQQETKVCKRTLTPSWNETLTFDSLPPRTSHVLVECFDHDLVGKHDFIGSVRIPITDLDLAKAAATQWYPLVHSGNAKFRAEVFLAVLPIYNTDAGSAEDSTEAGALSASPTGHEVVTLTAHVAAGRRLKAMDRNGFSDPYMVLQVGSASSKNKKRRRQTKVIKKNLAPEWNEQFEIDVHDLNEALTISVFDKDLIGAGDLIGETLLPLSTLVGNASPTWHEIYHESVVTGEVLLGFNLPRPQGYVSHEEQAQAAAAAAAAEAAAVAAAEAEALAAAALKPSEDDGRVAKRLAVNLVRGRAIAKKDLSGSSDGYVTFQIMPALGPDGNGTLSSTQRAPDAYRSRVIHQDLNPAWNEQFEVLLTEDQLSSEVLRVQLFDHDLVGSDDLIGTFDIALSSLEVTHESNPVWHPLYDDQNALAGKLLIGAHVVGDKIIEPLRVNTVLVGRDLPPVVNMRVRLSEQGRIALNAASSRTAGEEGAGTIVQVLHKETSANPVESHTPIPSDAEDAEASSDAQGGVLPGDLESERGDAVCDEHADDEDEADSAAQDAFDGDHCPENVDELEDTVLDSAHEGYEYPVPVPPEHDGQGALLSGEVTMSDNTGTDVLVRWDQSGMVGIYRVQRVQAAAGEGHNEPAGTQADDVEVQSRSFCLEALTEGEGAKMEGRMVCYESPVKRWLRTSSLPALWLGGALGDREEERGPQESAAMARMQAAAAAAAAALAESVKRAASLERYEEGELASQLAARERLRLKAERRQRKRDQECEALSPQGEAQRDEGLAGGEDAEAKILANAACSISEQEVQSEAEEDAREGAAEEPTPEEEEEDLEALDIDMDVTMETNESLDGADASLDACNAQELDAFIDAENGETNSPLKDGSAEVGDDALGAIVPPPPPPKNSYNARKRGKQVLKHRKQQAALTAAAAAAEAEEIAAQIAAALSLVPVLKARHGKSADMKLFLVRNASALLCQRMSEAAVFRLLRSSSDGTPDLASLSPSSAQRQITPLFARHRGCAHLSEHLARVFLNARLQRKPPRRTHSQMTEAACALRRVARARVYRNQHEAVKGVCAAMYMAPYNRAFQEQRAAVMEAQGWLRTVMRRCTWSREVEAAVCLQQMARRPLAMLTYPRWTAHVGIRSAVLRRAMRAEYVQQLDAAQTLTRCCRMLVSVLVRRRLSAGETLALTMVRLAPARGAVAAHSRALFAAQRIDAAAAGARARRGLGEQSRAAVLLSACVHRSLQQEGFIISRTLRDLVLRTGRECAQDTMQAEHAAALVLQAAAAAALSRAQTLQFLSDAQDARARFAAAVRAWRVRELESHAKKKEAVRLLHQRVAGALNRVAEAGVRYFVRFLWRRLHRTMMVRRLQRAALQACVRHPYSAQYATTIQLQARIRARLIRNEYAVLARGWRRRAELDDKRQDKRRNEEAEDAHALRVAERERERQWVSRSLEEEAVEETVLLATGEVLSSRVLSHEEYLRYLGLSCNVAPLVPAAEMRLVVRVVAGKALTAMDRSGTSDPYITLEVGSGGKDSRKKSRSRVVKASVNPLWEETLEVLVSAEEVANNVLTIRVWDKDLMPGADDLIGRCVLALAVFSQASHDSAPQWYTIYDEAKTVAGYINIGCALLPVLPAMSLTVDIVGARGLKAMDRGGTSDPYLTACIGRGPQKDKTKKYKTKVVSKSLCPEWNESCELPCNNYEINNEHVVIQIFDKDLLGDDLIGLTSLDLAAILKDTELHVLDDSHKVPEQWYTISDPKTLSTTGEVLLRLSLAPASEPMVVTVRVVACKALKAMDRSGTSDPYVVVQIGEKSKDARKRCQTQAIKKTLDPAFDETFQLASSKREMASEMVTVLVYDKDLVGADDLIGQVTLPLATMAEQGAAQADGTWHTILDPSQAAAGQVLVCLTAAPAPPAPTDVSVAIHVLHARDLKAMDRNGFSDPYVTFEVGKGKDKDQKGKTKV